MVLIAVVLGSQRAVSGQQAAWLPLTQGLSEAQLKLVAANPADSHQIYAGSSRLLYRSLDGGRQWEVCFRAPVQAQLLDIAVDPFNPKHLITATSDGLYASTNGGAHWEQVLGGVGKCRVARFHPLHPNHLWVGTTQGLFQSLDGGRNWRSVKVSSSQDAVRDIAMDSSDRLLTLTDRGLWVRKQETWAKLFPASGVNEPDSEELAEDIPEPPTLDHVTEVVVDPKDPNTVYLAGTQGMFISQDAGQTWQRATQLGLGSTEIRHLIVHALPALVVYAATSKGVARYRPTAGRWEALYSGLPTQSVHRLAASQSKVFAATDQGLYSLDLTEELLSEGHWPSAQELLGNFIHEPTIGQVHAKAIAYAEVNPDKILRWRRQAALQALLPTFSIGYDRDNDTYVTSSGSTTNPAFDRIIRAEDPSQSLDLSLSWDLSNLIWNDDQTSIDVRSKLMVQLRDEVLSDVTRTFFERRRLQIDLITEPPSDPKAQLDKELRLQELTALLDGFTGGWFSEQLRPASF